MANDALRTGLSFGLTSGVITTLGLMVGLHSGTRSELAVIGGILTIAVADGMSDALGIHISEESKPGHDARHVWLSTLSTFVAKFLMALSFVVPVLLFTLDTAVWVAIGWGLLVICLLSLQLARTQGEPVWRVAGEHLAITVAVVLATHWVGELIARHFHHPPA